jgi:hypothetical protein
LFGKQFFLIIISFVCVGTWEVQVCDAGVGVIEASGRDEAVGANGQDQGIWSAHRTGSKSRFALWFKTKIIINFLWVIVKSL